MNLPANERSRIRTMISSDGSIAQISGSEGMTIAGNVLMDMTVDTDQEISMISGMDLGEPLQPDPARPSLILCRAADENLWGIAKRTGSTVAQIQERNALSGEPQKGQMLLIPVL